MHIAIVGAGIGGLTLALELHDAGISCTIFESVTEISPVGVGVNVLPHASAVLSRLGLESALAETAITTRGSAFFNRFGQLICDEPAGRFAGYEFPQFSVHRGDLQAILLNAVKSRLGADAVKVGHRCLGVRQDEGGVDVDIEVHDAERTLTVRADGVVACDGIHSAIRKQFHPDEGEPLYSGVNMWRGVTTWQPFLSGATMVRAGWLNPGKMVIYPIRDAVDAPGNVLVNWVAEVETPRHVTWDWNRRGNIEDFIGAFEDWHFDWLDVPAMIRAADAVYEFPMVDQEPLDWWTDGRVTLLGDAAHPMVPRGSNGAGQAILDARAMRVALSSTSDVQAAFANYEALRRPVTTAVVETNRIAPPDILLKEVLDRTGDKPFDNIESVISRSEMEAISQRYKKIAGFTVEDVLATNDQTPEPILKRAK